MIPDPWTMSAEALEYIDTLPPEEQGPSLVAYQSYYYNSMKVPCFAAFAMYGLFVVLILAAAFNNLLAWTAPLLHNRIKQKLVFVRAYVWEHPLLSRSHATVVSLPGLRWLTLQLPLRGEALVVLGLFLINFIPLVAFYKILEPIPDSTSIDSKSAQICRALADRTGVLGTAQLPLLILMASKRTPVAIVSGLGQTSLMLYHRWIARWFWAHIFIHAVAYTVVGRSEQTFRHPNYWHLHTFRFRGVALFLCPNFSLQTDILSVFVLWTAYKTLVYARKRDWATHRFWAQLHTYLEYAVPIQRIWIYVMFGIGLVLPLLPAKVLAMIDYPLTDADIHSTEVAAFANTVFATFFSIAFIVHRDWRRSAKAKKT